MIKFLEEQLYQKTKDSQSEILFAQWNYDKKVIPNALQAVSTLFPHYSLHDESHSITIVNNIVRILGKENIEKLSAIDIWLILEASYSHDIGMVVSSEELIKSIRSEEFLHFFADLIEDEKNGLHEFANQFFIKDRQIRYKKDYLNLELHDGIKFILAEFFRRKHSDRSKEVIDNPSKELALTSPRGVIPQRIFQILGDICASHTKDFSQVMKLSFCEVGIDVEDAHPRFIACLLRIGDLLDLDNNRFSEVMLRTLSKIPVDTLTHKAKHLSIQSFRVDREKIEVIAKCTDYDTANITQHWFNYLNSEISNQMIGWNNIVPKKELGYLPTIGTLKVELSNYEYIDGKNKPKFSVDTDKALELLSGAGLYEGAYQCMREILQNAVDASLIRIWLEHRKNLNFSTPQSEDFLEIVKSYPVEISIKEKGIVNDFQNWLIKIDDKGTGISGEDLRYLMNTGSSSKNKKRSQVIESMPNWMKPSGTFGIGFQSIFLLTDFVKIETKSYFNEQYQIIELNGPNSPKDGDILIQKEKTDHSVKPGTRLELTYQTKAIPKRYSINGEHQNAMRIAHNFDPFSHESMDIELGKVIDEIFDFAYKSYIPIKLTIDEKEIKTEKSDGKKFDHFDKNTGLELKILYDEIDQKFPVTIYYKNQRAKSHIRYKFLGFDVNIHNEKASKVLTLSRNDLKAGYEELLEENILKASFKILTTNFHSIFQNEVSKTLGSMFLNYYQDRDYLKEYNLQNFSDWKSHKISVGVRDISIQDLLNEIETLKIISQEKFSQSDFFQLDDEKNLTITLRHWHESSDITSFFLFKAGEIFTAVEKKKNPDKSVEMLFTKQQQKDPIDKNELIAILKNGHTSSRMIIPCLEEFSVLRIRNDSQAAYVFNFPLNQNVRIEYPKMLSPFVKEEGFNLKSKPKLVLNDKVYNWVFDNRYNDKATREDIVDGYQKFIKEFEIQVLNNSI